MKKLFVSTLLVLAIIGLFSVSPVSAQTTPNSERGNSVWSIVLRFFGFDQSGKGGKVTIERVPVTEPQGNGSDTNANNSAQTSPSPSPVPQINSVVGPSSILVNQVGTWSIQAKNATKYAVVWNVPVTASDSSKNSTPADSEFGASNFITHAFTKPGNYHVKFFAKSSSGMVDVKGLDVKVNTLQSATAPASNSARSTTVKSVATSPSPSPSTSGTVSVSGPVYTDGQFKINWSSYNGDFDYYQIVLGNTIANVEVAIDENYPISKYQNSYNSFAVWYFVNKITSMSGRSTESIKDAYYVKVNAIKNDRVGGMIVNTSKSGNFSVISSSNASPSPSPYPANGFNATNQPSVSLIYPRGGETWYVGETKTVTWNYNNFSSGAFGNKYVRLLLVPTDGRAPVELASNYVAPYGTIPLKIYLKTSDGRDAWLPGKYKMKVVCDSNNVAGFKTCSDETAGYVTVVDPNPTPSPTSTVQPTTSLNNNQDIQASIWSAIKDYYKNQETR